MITANWIKRILGKERMKYVCDIKVFSGVVNLSLKEDFWFSNSETGLLIFEFDALDKMTKKEVKEYLIDSFSWVHLNFIYD
tara:strand:- start:76 stop:318 length:243 start_codon:yes stop_codon:yes gene_type:complete